jgi:glycosyltransferase involved in cell wall biosynthesis
VETAGIAKLSIVIPAYNEEKLLGACLASAREALAACARPGLESELVVCDNNSTDATARIAKEAGARVVFEPVNGIARARNAGAAAATGDWFLFIDADSRLSSESLRDVLEAAASGRHVGGGSLIDLVPKPWWGVWMVGLWSFCSRVFQVAAGSFVFCRADAFRECGGFPDDMAAAEEIGVSQALKRWGRPRGLTFLILTRQRHVSSGRKFYLYSPREFWAILWKSLRSPVQCFRDTKILHVLYDGRR